MADTAVDSRDALDWADLVLNSMITDIKAGGAAQRTARAELVTQMAQAAALVAIGYELRKIRRVLDGRPADG